MSQTTSFSTARLLRLRRFPSAMVGTVSFYFASRTLILNSFEYLEPRKRGYLWYLWPGGHDFGNNFNILAFPFPSADYFCRGRDPSPRTRPCLRPQRGNLVSILSR